MAEDGTEGPAGASRAGAGKAGTGAGGDGAGTEAAASPDRPGRTRTWWLAAGTFVLGLFAGAIVLGLLQESPPRQFSEPAPPAAAGPSDDPSPSPGAQAEIGVNEACLRVVNQTRDVLDAIEGLGESAADLDIAGVDQAIRQLQPLESRLREDLEACEVDTTLPGDLLTPLPSSESPATTSGSPSPR